MTNTYENTISNNQINEQAVVVSNRLDDADALIVPGALRARLIGAMTWMTDDMKHCFAADNPDTEGDYSSELKEAIELLRVLKEGR